jgi:hypothetical protein
MAKRAQKPTLEQFETAIMWLQVNDGDKGEAEACSAVADWIEHLRDEERLKQIARQAGVSVPEARRRLKELEY